MKWTEQTYKRKCLAILGVSVILLMLSFMFPFKRTIRTISDVNELTKQIEHSKEASTAIRELEKWMADWGSEWSTNLRKDEMQVKLFQEIGIAVGKNKLQLKNLKQIAEEKQNDYEIQTFEVLVVGSFHELLQTIWIVERQLKYGKIVSVNFEKKKNHEKIYDELYVKMVIQCVYHV